MSPPPATSWANYTSQAMTGDGSWLTHAAPFAILTFYIANIIQRQISMERIARTIAWIVLASLAAWTADQARAQDWAREMFDHTSHDFGTVARAQSRTPFRRREYLPGRRPHRVGRGELRLHHARSARRASQDLEKGLRGRQGQHGELPGPEGRDDQGQVRQALSGRSPVVCPLLYPQRRGPRTGFGQSPRRPGYCRAATGERPLCRPPRLADPARGMHQSQHYGQGARGGARRRDGELRSDGQSGGRRQGRLLPRGNQSRHERSQSPCPEGSSSRGSPGRCPGDGASLAVDHGPRGYGQAPNPGDAAALGPQHVALPDHAG